MILGVIGCGAVGRKVVDSVLGMRGIEHVHIYDQDEEKVKPLLGDRVSSVPPEEMGDVCDLVLEAASPEAVIAYVPGIVAAGTDVIVMSVGALMDRTFREELMSTASKSGAKVIVPSGAICGLDGMLSSAVGDLFSVVLTTVKNPASISATEEFIRERGMDPSDVRERTLVFEGTPEEAVRYFPRNVNVAAALTLAVGGKIKPLIRVYVDPEETRNVHEIVLEGEVGRITLTLDNLPSEENPKTSKLAVYSAVATIEKYLADLVIGT